MNRTPLLARPAPLLLGTALPLLAFATPAHATGVAAGTLIENTATATYQSGTATGSVTSNTVSLKVDELLNVAVTTLSASPLAAGPTTVALVYSVTNSGNGPEVFNLAVDPTVSGNGFTPTIAGVAIDTNNNGTYEPGVDTLLSGTLATPSLSADGSVKVLVLTTLPAGAIDTKTAQVRLTATAATGSGTPGTSFAGKGEGGGNAIVGLSTANANSLAGLIASLANVSLVKSATVADPFGTTNPVPGATISYSLAAKVTGTGTAKSLVVADVIPAGTTYVAGSLKLDGTALTDGADSDVGTGGASGISVALGDVAGGTTKTVAFSVKIN